MSQTQTPSAGCCNTPAVVSKGYKEKGEWTTVDGLKTYVTGPSTATQGILVVYDIFGYFPQTLQGADILAHADKEHQYQVFMPDFFEGKPADISWYPPDTEEKGKKLGEFFQTTAAPPKTVEKVKSVMKELTAKNSGIQFWGIVGYCWGGKIVNLSAGAGTPFKAAAACHPAMVDPNDAPNVTIPMLMIPSKDEDQEAVDKYEKGLKVAHQIEWFKDQVHGFMAARGDLEKEDVKAAYEKAYQHLLDFFHKQL
ncbi:putative AIM2 family protein C30D10.14 [Cladophialophora carrionii]|uniref:Putative AIM2 family protein C30D10.14 n=1 Tax=Cladophialophora carrionii TaxID=86049 RepID=A0A1C1CA94_9EURO|nr:putative AIM2 family protein C30D10.14 [Cladophialophora carrionii]